MTFSCGCWVYRVRVARTPLRDGRGQRLTALVHWRGATIWLDPGLPVEIRLAVLLHELRHVWDAHCPGTRDEEQEAEFTATVAATVFEQLQSQGGRQALEALEPERRRRRA